MTFEDSEDQLGRRASAKKITVLLTFSKKPRTKQRREEFSREPKNDKRSIVNFR
jgi:hypothetical protein